MDIYGADNKLRLSYNDSNYGDISVTSAGRMIIQPAGTSAYLDIMQSNALYGFLMHKDTAWGGQGIIGANNDFAISTGTVSQDIAFICGNFLSGNERMRVMGSGNVGIGTPSPTDKLDVNGSTRLRGALKDSTGSYGTNGQILKNVAGLPVWSNP